MQFPRPQTFPVLRPRSPKSDRDNLPAESGDDATLDDSSRGGATQCDSAATTSGREPSAAEGTGTFTVKRAVAARRQVLSMQDADRQGHWQDRLSNQRQQINRRLDQIHTQLQRMAGPQGQPQLSVVGLPAED